MDNYKWYTSCHAKAGILLALWLLVFGGGLFLVGDVLKNIGLFFILYNVLYPIANVVACGVFTRKYGLVLWLPIIMITLSVIAFIFTDLMGYALPNVIVTTIITVFFSCGIASALHGKRIKEVKPQKTNNYKNIIDDEK